VRLLRIHLVWTLQLTAALTAVLIASPAFADTETSRGDRGGESGDPLSSFYAGGQADLFSGSFSMSAPIQVPPARRNLTPELELSYSSTRGDSPFGYGWDLPIGQIRRKVEKGATRCQGDHTTNTFLLDLPGTSAELVYVGNDLYHARYDEAFIEVTVDVNANQWTLVDRRGLRFTFGTTSTSRYFGPDGASDAFHGPLYDHPDGGQTCAITSRWLLTRIEDSYGNTIDMSYWKPSGELMPLLRRVEYGGNPAQGLAHPFQLLVSYTARNVPAVSASRATGVEQITHVADEIQVWRRTAPAQTSYDEIVRTYVLGHVFAPQGGRYLLTSIASEDIPTRSFEYSTADFELGPETVHTPPASAHWGLRFYNRNGLEPRGGFMDLNGDGFADIIRATGDAFLYGLSSADGLADELHAWDSSNIVGYAGAARDVIQKVVVDEQVTLTRTDIFDLTGDGIVDYVLKETDGYTLQEWVVFPGYCDAPDQCGFGSAINFSIPQSSSIRASFHDTEQGGLTVR